MKQKKFIINEKILTIEIADTFLKRLRGLMFRRRLESSHGLLITPCNSIHMMFMFFKIDAVYLDKNFVIKKIVRNLTPFISLSMCLEADSVLELNGGEAQNFNLQVGQKFLQC